MTSLSAAARAVLLPIHESLDVSPWLEDHLKQGGRTVLIASSIAEYDARHIASERAALETSGDHSQLHRCCD